MLQYDIKLGMEVRDIITGYKGIVMGITCYLNGCVSIGVQKQKLEKGAAEIPKWVWIDVQQLEILKRKSVLESSSSISAGALVGGPQPEPKNPNQTPR